MSPSPCQRCPVVERAAFSEGKFQFQPISIDDLGARSRDRYSLTVFFAQANKIRRCSACKDRFTEHLNMPVFWWSDWCRRLNGYFGSEATTGKDGNLDGYNTWLRLLVKRILSKKTYEWLKFNIFIRWNASTKEHILVVFDATPPARKLLTDHLPNTMAAIHSESPHSIYVPLAQLAVELQEDAVWRIRDAVRAVEKDRTSLYPKVVCPQNHFCYLHDLARHAVHVFETLDLTAQTLHSMIEYHNRSPTLSASSPAMEGGDCDGTGNQSVGTTHRNQLASDRLRFYQEAIQALRLRSIANKDRLQNEIQYSFNLVAQTIARSSNEIVDAVQLDSSVMKTIALATAAFIPMTFIATLFGMQFFAYSVDSGIWNVSGKFWVFWAVGIPFTSVFVFVAHEYHRMRYPRK